jgi:hypothetical protein
MTGTEAHLTSEQRITLKMLYKSSRGSRFCDRVIYIFLADEGWPAGMIAES